MQRATEPYTNRHASRPLDRLRRLAREVDALDLVDVAGCLAAEVGGVEGVEVEGPRIALPVRKD